MILWVQITIMLLVGDKKYFKNNLTQISQSGFFYVYYIINDY
jgi:hypothetical protein